MAKRIIDARVRQKSAPLEEWNNSDLDSLDGEQLFVRSDVDDAVIGFKLGAKNKKFSELPYPDFTVRGKVSTSSTWIGRQSGVYIPTSNGVYRGVPVNLTDGYQVLYWDGSTIEKVVYPNDYVGAVFGGVIDDSKDLSNPTEPIWYIASPGTYNTIPPITLTENSILTWNGVDWSYIPFNLEVRGEFLVADTIDEIRGLSEPVVETLLNGTYKGMLLLGWDLETKYSIPIYYYVSETTVPANDITIIDCYGVKLEHTLSNSVDVIYFGIKPNDGIDRTSDFTKMVSIIPEFSDIVFAANSSYIGNIISSKSFNIYFNNSTIENGKSNVNSSIVYFNGDITYNYTSLVGTAPYGTYVLNMLDVSGISSGDLIVLVDQTLRPQDSSNINREILEVKSVDYDNNTVEIYDIVRSEQVNGTINVHLIKPNINASVYDLNIKSDNTHVGHQLFFVGCKNVKTSNISTYNNVGNGIGHEMCYSIVEDNVVHNKPRLIGGGQGYGSFYGFCKDISISNVKGYGMRHTVDFSSCYNYFVDGVRDNYPAYPIMIAHNTVGGNASFNDIIVEGNKAAALIISPQGFSNANAHVFRDLNIKNIQHIVKEDGVTTNIRSINLSTSVYNLNIDRVEVVNNIPGYVNQDTDAAVFLSSCSINGNVNISNIYSNKISYALWHSFGTTIRSNNSIISLKNIAIRSGLGAAYLSGTTSIQYENIDILSAIPVGNPVFYINFPNITRHVDFVGRTLFINTYTPIYSNNLVDTKLLTGAKPLLNSGDETVTTVLTNTTFTNANIDCRSVIKLAHTPIANITLTSSSVLPSPTNYNQKISIQLNTPDDTSKGSVIIPSSNINIYNKSGTNGITILSGKTVYLESCMISGKRCWKEV